MTDKIRDFINEAEAITRKSYEDAAQEEIKLMRQKCGAIESKLRDVLGDDIYNALKVRHVYKAEVKGQHIGDYSLSMTEPHLAFFYGGLDWKVKGKFRAGGNVLEDFDLDGVHPDRPEKLFHNPSVRDNSRYMLVEPEAKLRIYFLGLLAKCVREASGFSQEVL